MSSAVAGRLPAAEPHRWTAPLSRNTPRLATSFGETMGWKDRWPERTPRLTVQPLSDQEREQTLDVFKAGIVLSPVLSSLDMRVRSLRGRFYFEKVWPAPGDKPAAEVWGRATPTGGRRLPLNQIRVVISQPPERGQRSGVGRRGEIISAGRSLREESPSCAILLTTSSQGGAHASHPRLCYSRH